MLDKEKNWRERKPRQKILSIRDKPEKMSRLQLHANYDWSLGRRTKKNKTLKKSEEEDVAIVLRGIEPLTGPFTTANVSSEEE